jgi:hypothetical protein
MLTFSGVCIVKSFSTIATQMVLYCMQPAEVSNPTHSVYVPENYKLL